MPKPFIVNETLPPLVYATVPLEGYDHVPDDPDSFVVTFTRGRATQGHDRVVYRDIQTRTEADEIAASLNAEYGQFGRRAVISAVKGFRAYNIV